MKYFTMELWQQSQTSEAVPWPLAEYGEHLERIRDRIPAWFLEPDFCLHDSHLRRVCVDVQAGELVLELDRVSRARPESHEYGAAELRFNAVSRFESTADEDGGFGGPSYGDWGYEEVDVADGGTPELRVLFSSGIEFLIRFGGFRAIWLG